jgi:hypothetical protein
VDLYGHGKGSNAKLRRMSTRAMDLRSKRRVIRLRIRRAASLRPRGRVRATAVAGTGGVTKRSRSVRIR